MSISSLIKLKKKRIKKRVKNPNEHMTPYCSSFEDLASGLTDTGIYSHLRLILTKNNDHTLVQKYLYVSRDAFGLVRLHDVDFNDNQIALDLEVVSTGQNKRVYLDIDDPTFKFLLISWHDIRQILNSEIVHKTDSSDLLDFKF